MRISEDISGLLLIDKPHGWTSFDCVKRIKSVLESGMRARGFKIRHLKVGHSGTLDPFATGLMILGIGKKGTARMGDFMNADKKYIAEIGFGILSPTYDLDSTAISVEKIEPDLFPAQEVKRVLKNFTGEHEQVPPKFSAVKVNGKRAYLFAREGKDVELKSRKVNIYDVDVGECVFEDSDIGGEKFCIPVLKDIVFFVSKGTYIRSIVRDLGAKVGIPAALVALRRTEIILSGGKTFLLDDALRFSRETTFEEIVGGMKVC